MKKLKADGVGSFHLQTNPQPQQMQEIWLIAIYQPFDSFITVHQQLY